MTSAISLIVAGVHTQTTPHEGIPTMTNINDLPTVDTAAAIEVPTACAPYAIGRGVTVLPTFLPVPGMGVLPAHSFLVDGSEPMLVDTGAGGAEQGYRAALASVVDVAAIRWIWLTHTDPDHTANLAWLLEAAPDAKLVTTFLAVGKLGMQMPVPMDRLLWVNPGTSVELGGRRLHAMRPPTFDAPETTAFFDETSRTLYAADTFGALLRRPTGDAGDVDACDLADGMALWSTIDSPWVTHTDRDHYRTELARVRALGAERVLSSHLPPASGMADRLIDNLTGLPGAAPWVGPDQTALDQLLASVTG